MKVRVGFVSNSSSASFVLKMDGLTLFQINAIENHIYFARTMKSKRDKDGHTDFGYLNRDEDAWMITVDEEANEIHGYTIINNFGMEEFLKFIGVDMSKVEFNYH
jgi:hypothetical protein